MLNVLIVDDEIKVCQLVEKLIPWDELRLNKAGVAHNGMDALEMAEKRAVDIVLTDIRMPGLDGIELIKRLKASKPHIAFIIISGHRDFDYAQSALKYGASDFLLKPIGKEDLRKALASVIENKKISTARLLHEENLEEELEKKTAFIDGGWLREQYRSGFEASSMETVDAVSSKHGVRLHQGSFEIIVGKLDIMKREDINLELNRTLMEKIADIFAEAFGPITEKAIFTVDDCRLVGLLNNSDRSSINKTLFESIYEKIATITLSEGKYHFTVGVGKAVARVGELGQSCQSASILVNLRIFNGVDKVYMADKGEKKEKPEKAIILEELEAGDSLIQTFGTFDKVKIKSELNRLFSVLEAQDCERNAKTLTEFCGQLLDMLWGQLSLLGIESEIEDFRPSVLEWLDHAVSYADLKHRMIREVEYIVDEANKSKKIQEFRPVRIAKQYIDENYMNQIVLEDIAEIVGLNPVYFSVLFKRESGENFKEYLTHYRMEKAKEYFRTTNFNIGQVSERVGYKDKKYFSKLFVKQVGIRPKEYKRIYG